MTTDAATITAALRKLAEPEEACPDCHGSGAAEVQLDQGHGHTPAIGCSPCSGTGGVPLFRDAKGKALFRKECPQDCAHDVDAQTWNDYEGRLPLYCGNQGWLPLTPNEVHLETVLEAIGGTVTFTCTPKGWLCTIGHSSRHLDGVGATPLEAALLALVAAMEARA